MRQIGGPALTLERLARTLLCGLIAFALSCAAPSGHAHAGGGAGGAPSGLTR